MRSASIFRDGRARLGVVLAIVLSAGPLTAQTDTPSTVYRAGTDLVVLQVSVSDGQRRHVSGLHAENFTVLDEGVPQPVAVFATSESPLDVLLLMDTSGSMGFRLPDAKRAGANLVGSLRREDRAGLIVFDTGATVAHALSHEHARVVQAIHAVAPAGATALYDAVYLGLHMLSRARRPAEGVRRQALVVLTDGADNASRIPFEQALEAARRGDVTIFTIMPGLPPPNTVVTPDLSWRDATSKFEMRRLAEDTGGRSFLTTDPAGVADVYEQIGSELRAQYWLAYAAGPGQHGFRRVSVRVNDPPGLLARTRTGYDAGSAKDAPPARTSTRRSTSSP